MDDKPTLRPGMAVICEGAWTPSGEALYYLLKKRDVETWYGLTESPVGVNPTYTVTPSDVVEVYLQGERIWKAEHRD